MGSPRLAPNTTRDALASREPLGSLGWPPSGGDPDALSAHPPQRAAVRPSTPPLCGCQSGPPPCHGLLPCWEEPGWPSQASTAQPHSNRAQLHRISATMTRGRPSFGGPPLFVFVCLFVCLFDCFFVCLFVCESLFVSLVVCLS